MAAGNVQGAAVSALRIARTVTNRATISVTKMTGLRISFAGLSLANASRAARAMIAPSNRAIVSAVWAMVWRSLVRLASEHFEMLR